MPHSLPKLNVLTQPSLFSMDIAPVAKNSALEAAYKVGSSMTRSAPPDRAIFVRMYLFTIAGSPRCTKSPLMTTMV